MPPASSPISSRGSNKYEREEARLKKEIQKRFKEKSKLDLTERDKLEVEAHENEIQVLQTVHRECSSPMDWNAVAFSLPPHHPLFSSSIHLEATARACFSLPDKHAPADSNVDAAWEKDISRYQVDIQKYHEEYERWSRQKSLAQRVIQGDTSVYAASIHEFGWFGEIATWGDAFSFKSKDSKRAECQFPINGRDIIPTQSKTLTSAGKLSSKQTSQKRFHELYQAYVCGCALRVGREIFALLPLDEVIVTATVLMLCTSTGLDIQQPVLSVCFDKKTIHSLNFKRLNPVDALENFNYNGFIKSSQKNDQFEVIAPLFFDASVEATASTHQIDLSMEAVMTLRKKLQIGTNQQPTTLNGSFC